MNVCYVDQFLTREKINKIIYIYQMSPMKVIVAVVLCVMVSVITARPAVEDPLDEMNQASANVMATLKELQEKMLAEEGRLRFSLLSLYFSMDKKNSM